MCLEGVKKYLATREFAAASWEIGTMGPVKTYMPNFDDLHYRFNWLEDLGNYLLDAPYWVLTRGCRAAENNECFYIALVIIGIAATAVGLVGLAFKTAGELFNTHSGRRYQALVLHKEIDHMVDQIMSDTMGTGRGLLSGVLDAHKITGMFRDHILKGIHEATDQEVSSLELYGGLLGNLQSIQTAMRPPEETGCLKICQDLGRQWKEAFTAYTEKVQAGVDASEAEHMIQGLVQAHEPTLVQVKEFFADCKTRRENAKRLVEYRAAVEPKIVEYNALIAQMN